MNFFVKLFDTADFPARWHCGTWPPLVGWLTIISDILIFVAYSAIPMSLAVILLRRRDIPFPWILRLFVAFILSCGITHLIDAIIFYEPVYRLQSVVKAFTAAVSLTTACVLIRSLPNLIALRGIRAQNVALTAQLGEMRSATDVLEKERSDLESHSAQMSLKWRRVIASLEATGGVACHWKLGADAFDWEVGLMECAQRVGLGAHRSPNWSALIGPEAAQELHDACRHHLADKGPFDFAAAVPGAPHLELHLRVMVEPEVRGQTRSMIGFFRLWSASERKTKPPAP